VAFLHFLLGGSREVLRWLSYQIVWPTSSAQILWTMSATPVRTEPRVRPSSISFGRCRTNSVSLVSVLLGVGRLAGVLAGQTNSTLLLPLVSESSPVERGETKAVPPLLGTDRSHICSRKFVESWQKLHVSYKAPHKIKILPHLRGEAGLERTQPNATGVKLSIYWRLLGTVTVDKHYVRPHSPLVRVHCSIGA